MREQSKGKEIEKERALLLLKITVYPKIYKNVYNIYHATTNCHNLYH
jgi:hypothetical protein